MSPDDGQSHVQYSCGRSLEIFVRRVMIGNEQEFSFKQTQLGGLSEALRRCSSSVCSKDALLITLHTQVTRTLTCVNGTENVS